MLLLERNCSNYGWNEIKNLILTQIKLLKSNSDLSSFVSGYPFSSGPFCPLKMAAIMYNHEECFQGT